MYLCRKNPNMMIYKSLDAQCRFVNGTLSVMLNCNFSSLTYMQFVLMLFAKTDFDFKELIPIITEPSLVFI